MNRFFFVSFRLFSGILNIFVLFLLAIYVSLLLTIFLSNLFFSNLLDAQITILFHDIWNKKLLLHQLGGIVLNNNSLLFCTNDCNFLFCERPTLSGVFIHTHIHLLDRLLVAILRIIWIVLHPILFPLPIFLRRIVNLLDLRLFFLLINWLIAILPVSIGTI